jgi:hypothetical protein
MSGFSVNDHSWDYHMWRSDSGLRQTIVRANYVWIYELLKAAKQAEKDKRFPKVHQTAVRRVKTADQARELRNKRSKQRTASPSERVPGQLGGF